MVIVIYCYLSDLAFCETSIGQLLDKACSMAGLPVRDTGMAKQTNLLEIYQA